MKKIISVLIALAMVAGLVIVIQKVASQESNTPSPSGSESDEGGIVITEVMTNNGGIYPDDQGNPSDWVELYNTTDQAVSLNRYMLSDDAAEPAKWVFPAVEVEAHSYAVVFLTGDNQSDASKGIMHCTFSSALRVRR
jgi:hypothetical protein